jgi:mannitol-1-phosphate 5-dehydrogenase
MRRSGVAVVIGAGNVGCGVIAEQLSAAGWPVVMVTRTQRDADRIVSGGVRVRYADGAGGDVVLRGLAAVSVTNPARVTASIREAALVVVAVGSGHVGEIAPLLARGLMARRSPVNVVVCENRGDAATRLGRLVVENGDDRVLRHGYVGALVDRIVNRCEQPDGSRVLLAETTGAVYLDARALRAPLVPAGQLRLVEHFEAYVQRKLFVFSAGHVASAYLGGLRGHGRICEALADEDVACVVRAALREGQAGVAATFGERFAGDEATVEELLRRYAAPHLDDTVERVGRDPLRKLGADDRICGPARLAMTAGRTTPALALVAAAALRRDQQDSPPNGCEPHPQFARRRRASVLARSSGLPDSHPFLDLVLEANRMLDTHSQLRSIHARLSAAASSMVRYSSRSLASLPDAGVV